MGRRKRRTFSKEFKVKVVLEAFRERKTAAELATEFEVTPNQISTWKRQVRESLAEIFGFTAKQHNQSSSGLRLASRSASLSYCSANSRIAVAKRVYPFESSASAFALFLFASMRSSCP